MTRQLTVLMTVCLACLAPAVRATTFVAMSERELARAADAIVLGTVERIESVARSDGAIQTLITLAVEERLKGRVADRVVLRQPGGRVGKRAAWIHGSPRFTTGERTLVFLTVHRDGAVRTTAYGMGQFHIDASGLTGSPRAERVLNEMVVGGSRARGLSLARLERTIARALATDPRPVTARPIASPVETAARDEARVVVDAFTLMDTPGRWPEPDLGQPVTYDVDGGGDAALGSSVSLAAIDAAMAAWTNVSGAAITLARSSGVAPRPLACDGTSSIVFNDPGDDMPAPRNCSGILALGGFCASSETDVVGGTTFFRITEGDISFNRGFGACSFWNQANLAEVSTHELGHTIGLGHSSEADGESNLVLKDATMYYRAHFDGRGASVRADDIAGVRAVYPGPGGGPDDLDGDGVEDASDNCPALANVAQTDADKDGSGDLCDPCPVAAACDAIAGGNLRLVPGARSRLLFRGTVALAPGDPDVARARLVSGSGVLLDTTSLSGVARARSRRARMRYRGEGAVITLRRVPGGAFQVRIVVRDAAVDVGAAPLVSANLQVGEQSFTAPLICSAGRRGQLECRA